MVVVALMLCNWVIVVRMVVVLWDGFRYAYYLSVVCLDYSLLLYRIYAYIYCVPAFMHSYTAFPHSCIHLQPFCIADTVVCLELSSGVTGFRFVVINCCCAVACACILNFLG